MACWVAPAVAAEFWGVSLEEVWTRVQNGSAACKSDSGFTFIDVAPGSAEIQAHAPVAAPSPVLTYVAVDQQPEAIIACSGEDEYAGQELPNRQSVRARVAKLRIPPRAA